MTMADVGLRSAKIAGWVLCQVVFLALTIGYFVLMLWIVGWWGYSMRVISAAISAILD